MNRDELSSTLRRSEREQRMVLRAIGELKQELKEMWDELKNEIARNKEVDASARMLLQGLHAKLVELASRPNVDQAQVKALADELRASTDELAAAVVANTPAGGETVETRPEGMEESGAQVDPDRLTSDEAVPPETEVASLGDNLKKPRRR